MGRGKGYQTLMNEALRQHVDGKAPKLEETLRRIAREEVRKARLGHRAIKRNVAGLVALS